MLDLSAAIDVIDHNIFLKAVIFIWNIWHRAFMDTILSNRSRSVLSNDMNLKYGVPQGSVLGPELYCMFSKPVGEICRRHKMSYHCYVDDTHVSLLMRPLEQWSELSTRLKLFLSNISAWMSSNLQKLNQAKMELIVFALRHRLSSLSYFRLTFD